MVKDNIIEIYETIPKDLRGKDERLATLQGLRNVAIDVVDIQNSVKNFIKKQLDEITGLFDEFWEKNPNAAVNPYSSLVDIFVKLDSYARENDFEDVVSDLDKVLEENKTELLIDAEHYFMDKVKSTKDRFVALGLVEERYGTEIANQIAKLYRVE